MASFPSYVEILFDGYSETFDPSVETTEMERGVPKQRTINSRVLMKLSCALLFKSAADVAAFESWYFDTIKRIGFFTMTHPRTKVTINARFDGGSIGTLIPMQTQFRVARRDVVLEYMR